MNTDQSKREQELRAAARRLARKLPPELREDSDLDLLLSNRSPGAVAILHLINRCDAYESNSKDYEFSRMTVRDHWRTGYEDARFSLEHPDWRNRACRSAEIATFDLAGERHHRTGGSEGAPA